jgi:hypothetical protein
MKRTVNSNWLIVSIPIYDFKFYFPLSIFIGMIITGTFIIIKAVS